MLVEKLARARWIIQGYDEGGRAVELGRTGLVVCLWVCSLTLEISEEICGRFGLFRQVRTSVYHAFRFVVWLRDGVDARVFLASSSEAVGRL